MRPPAGRIVDAAAEGAVPFLRRLGHRQEGDALPSRYDRLTSTVRHWSVAVAPS